VNAYDLANILEGIPVEAEVLVLALDGLNRAYRVISTRTSNHRGRSDRPSRLYLVLEAQGLPVSSQRLLSRPPFRP